MLKTVGFPSTRTGDQTIVNGNLVIATSGKGIDFSATSHPAGMTSELLSDYEEGSWTGTLTTDTTPPTTPPTATGYYVKVGDLVTVQLAMNAVNTSGASGNIKITGLPFASTQMGMGSVTTYNMNISVPYVAQVNAGESFLVFVSAGPFMAQLPISAGTDRYVYLSLTYIAS